MRLKREWLLLLGSLLVVAALYNHYLGHSAYLVEIILVSAGILLALLSLRAPSTADKAAREGLLVTLLSRWMSKDRYTILIPFAGFLIIASWSIWKLFLVGDASMRMEDFLVPLLGLALIVYDATPSKYADAKDFSVLYLAFMVITFAVIWKLYAIVSGDSYFRINAYSEYYLITIPVTGILSIIGVPARAELDLSGHGLSNTIIYDHHGSQLVVGIGSGCSGLYAAGLFFSAFMAFVLVRYRRVDARIGLGLGLGFLLTWIANILRMVITVYVGHLYGSPALAFVHSYIGVVVFVVLITAFWVLIVRWLDKGAASPRKDAEAASQNSI